MKKIKDFLKKKFVCRVIRKSGLLDCEYYLQSNLDVARSCMNPVRHYIYYGWREGRNPNRVFDTKWYLEAYPSVEKAGVNPLYHYFKHGAMEGRDPSPTFSTQKYLAANPDVIKSGLNPLTHFMKYNKTAYRSKDNAAVANSAAKTPYNTIPRKLAYAVTEVNKTISADVVQDIYCNIYKELFGHKQGGFK